MESEAGDFTSDRFLGRFSARMAINARLVSKPVFWVWSRLESEAEEVHIE